MMITFSSIKLFSQVKKLDKEESKLPPKHPSQTLLDRFLAIITSHCKISLLSLDQWRLVITLTMLKIILVCIWYPTMVRTWPYKKKDIWELSLMCFPSCERIFTFFMSSHASNEIKNLVPYCLLPSSKVSPWSLDVKVHLIMKRSWGRTTKSWFIISLVILFWFIADLFSFCFLGMICARLAMPWGAMVVVVIVVIFF
jgi:hypothetical protein